MGKRKNLFNESLILNKHTYTQYLNWLTELAISMFKWKNLPETVDARYIEMQLFLSGAMVYFNDEVIGDLCLNCLAQGSMDVYGYPIKRRAYSAYNNYQKTLNPNNSVIIYNNYMRTNSVLDVQMYARRLYNIDRIIDVNVNAQKTPVLVRATEKQRMTMMQLYMQYDGNEPFIFGDKDLDLNSLAVLKTDAPYVADKLYALKTEIWNEALTHLGISNVNINKKERLITNEVSRTQGGTIASRYSRLDSRQEAAEKINNMFGHDIEVDYRDELQLLDNLDYNEDGNIDGGELNEDI